MRIKKHKNLLNHRSAPKGAQGVTLFGPNVYTLWHTY